MTKFEKLPVRPTARLPWPRAAGADLAQAATPACGGCGAKIGQDALKAGLGATVPGDDAARIGAASRHDAARMRQTFENNR